MSSTIPSLSVLRRRSRPVIFFLFFQPPWTGRCAGRQLIRDLCQWLSIRALTAIGT